MSIAIIEQIQKKSKIRDDKTLKQSWAIKTNSKRQGPMGVSQAVSRASKLQVFSKARC